MSSDDRITRYTGALRALGYGSDLVEARRVSDHRGVRYVVSVDGYTDDMRAVYWSSGRLELTGGDGPWGDMPEDPLPPRAGSLGHLGRDRHGEAAPARGPAAHAHRAHPDAADRDADADPEGAPRRPALRGHRPASRRASARRIVMTCRHRILGLARVACVGGVAIRTASMAAVGAAFIALWTTSWLVARAGRTSVRPGGCHHGRRA